MTAPAEVLAGLMTYVGPGEQVTIPHGLALALSAAPAADGAAPPDHGSAPGGDFTPADLMRRYDRSRGWVREKMSGGDFGKVYRHGREPVAPRDGVLAYDQRQRERAGSSTADTEIRPNRSVTNGRGKADSSAGLSLVERRQRA